MFNKLILAIVTICFCTFTNANAGESLKLAPELGEWSLTAAVFYTARKIDEMSVWISLSSSKGTTDRSFHENTISSSKLYAAAGAAALGIGFIPNNDGWLKESSYRHSKGIVEALSATYLVTNVTKNIVGRKRPSFDNYPESDRVDADKSFPSGHTSISFALATYSTLYVFDHIGHWDRNADKAGKLLYLTGSHVLAAYVGYTRVTDNRHFVSDVIAGGLIGSAVSALVYHYQNSCISQSGSSDNVSKKTSPVLLSFNPFPASMSLTISF